MLPAIDNQKLIKIFQESIEEQRHVEKPQLGSDGNYNKEEVKRWITKKFNQDLKNLLSSDEYHCQDGDLHPILLVLYANFLDHKKVFKVFDEANRDEIRDDSLVKMFDTIDDCRRIWSLCDQLEISKKFGLEITKIDLKDIRANLANYISSIIENFYQKHEEGGKSLIGEYIDKIFLDYEHNKLEFHDIDKTLSDLKDRFSQKAGISIFDKVFQDKNTREIPNNSINPNGEAKTISRTSSRSK